MVLIIFVGMDDNRLKTIEIEEDIKERWLKVFFICSIKKDLFI